MSEITSQSSRLTSLASAVSSSNDRSIAAAATAVSQMVDHDVVVPLYGTVEGGSGLDAAVEAFELPYRVAGIENDNIFEFRGTVMS